MRRSHQGCWRAPHEIGVRRGVARSRSGAVGRLLQAVLAALAFDLGCGPLRDGAPLPDRVIAPHVLHAVGSFALLLSCTDLHQITLHDS